MTLRPNRAERFARHLDERDLADIASDEDLDQLTREELYQYIRNLLWLEHARAGEMP